MNRLPIQALANECVAEGRPLDWFEEAYARRAAGRLDIPWVDSKPNPILVARVEKLALRGARCLVVGCGLGDDAVFLANRGLDVTAFDLSPTAIAECRRRFPTDSVNWIVADLLVPPAHWREAFHLVVEVFTLQVLPGELRRKALEAIASFVAPGGSALLIARGREPSDDPGHMPWPLTKDEMRSVADLALDGDIDDFMDDEDVPVRRFVGILRRP